MTIKKVHGGKNVPDYAIFGYCPIGGADRALFPEPIIGYYGSEELAAAELQSIFAAMGSGADVYKLN